MVAPADKSKSITKLREVNLTAEFPLKNNYVAVVKRTAEGVGGETVGGEVIGGG